MAKDKNSASRCIIVLLVIAVVCVALLAILNDLLYVPPDMSVFNKAAEGTYEEDEIKDVAVSSGKVVVVTKGTLTDGTEVVGMYVTGNKFGKSDSFSLAIVVDKSTNKIVGAYEIADGSTGGYAYDEAHLSAVIGTDVLSTDYANVSGLVQTGTTNSSNAVKNAVSTAAEYYSQVYGK